MKAPLTTLITFITLFITAIAGTTNRTSDIIAKIAAMPVGQLLTDEAAEAIADKTIKMIESYPEPDFNMSYYDARSTTYGQKSLDSVLAGNEAYDFGKTVVVACIKEHLHKNNNLVTFYSAQRDKIRLKLNAMSPDARKKAKAWIATARAAFLDLKQPETLKKFEEAKMAESNYLMRGRPDHFLSDVLGKNLQLTEVAKTLSEHTLLSSEELEEKQKSFESLFIDKNLAKFAGRRAVEGGTALLDKYLELLALIAADIPAA